MFCFDFILTSCRFNDNIANRWHCSVVCLEELISCLWYLLNSLFAYLPAYPTALPKHSTQTGRWETDRQLDRDICVSVYYVRLLCRGGNEKIKRTEFFSLGLETGHIRVASAGAKLSTLRTTNFSNKAS